MAPAAAPPAPCAAAAPICAAPLATEEAAEANRNAVMTAPTAQTSRPCAVSRKKTSSVCAATQRVRRRPARYPPRPEANNCTAMNHAPANRPKVATDILWLDHGDTDTRP